METLHLLLLALVQGITEFLPISSSGHLILLPRIAGWQDQGLGYDIAVHLGTLIAVVGYFRRDLTSITTAWCRSLSGHGQTDASRLAWYLIVGTLPVAIAGLAFHDLIATHLRSPVLIATTTIGFGVLLGLADRLGRRRRELGQLGWPDAVIIGCCQALALVPGTSRSGVTMTAGLALGLSRVAAARFSFLLAVPVIILAGLNELRVLAGSGLEVDWGSLASVTILAGVSAFFCVHFFLKLIERVGMLPFVLYRLVFGIFLLWFFST